jgi:glycosyltransferase involved in cell wall biosynthesis
MKVLHVLLAEQVGGGEIATRRIADTLRPLGVVSSALLLRPSERLAGYLREAGVETFDAEPQPEPSLRRGGHFLLDSRRLARRLSRFDLLHCADVPAAYHAAVAGRLAGLPVLCHVRNRFTRLPLRDRIFIGAASHFVFVSKATRDSFPMRLAAARGSVLYDGIDLPAATELAQREAMAREVRAEFGLAPEVALATMFARVAPAKDHPTLIRAAAILRAEGAGIHFLLIGDQSQHAANRAHFEMVQALIDNAGLADIFTFTGFRSDVRRLMLASDICLLSTHTEGMPLVIIEAMAAGRPIVATAVDGILDVVTDGTTGLLSPHQDAPALAARIAGLLADPARAADLGRAARAEAEARFSQERFAQDLLALYRRFGSAARLAGRNWQGHNLAAPQ